MTALLGFLAVGCTGDRPEKAGSPSVTSSPSSSSSSIGGIKSIGRFGFVNSDALVAAAWDGKRLWLLDPDRRLVSVDGKTGEILTNQILDIELSPEAGLTVLGAKLLAFGQVSTDKPVQLVQIDVESGRVERKPVSQGRPLGQASVEDGRIQVADYELGIVSVKVETAEVNLLVRPGVSASLVQPAGEDSFWVVDDNRSQLIRVDLEGNRKAEARADGYIGSLRSDVAGYAWLAQQNSVNVFQKSGELLRTFVNFKNVFSLFRCADSMVASDVETGQIAWLSVDGEDRRLNTNTPGRVTACAGEDVWFATVTGDYFRLSRPTP